MNPAPNVSFIGRSNTDCVISNAALEFGDNSVTLNLPGGKFNIATRQRALPGRKVTADIPAGAFAFAGSVRQGGGAFNSASAYRLISRRAARYLDTCSPDEGLTRRMTKLRIAARYLGLYPSPRNLVVGSDGDRTILRSPVPPTPGLNEYQAEWVAWACAARFVAANSVGDPSVMRHAIRAATSSGAHLLAMVTPALPSRLVIQEVIPVSRAIFAAWDEIPRILGSGFHATPVGAVHALLHIHGLAPGATIFITLGKRGVLVASPGIAPVHVSLRPPAYSAVQQWIAHDPARACGSGDAFLAGAAAWYAEGASLMTRPPQTGVGPIQAAISGCAAAIRWTGYCAQLTAEDFAVVNLINADPAEYMLSAA